MKININITHLDEPGTRYDLLLQDGGILRNPDGSIRLWRQV